MVTTKTRTKDEIIEPALWGVYFAQFTRYFRGAHATLEVLGPGVGYQVMTNDWPFDGLAADFKDKERSVWITFGFGSNPEDRLTHGIHNVVAVRTGPPPAQAAAVLEIEAKDGNRTLLTLTRPEEYALPPGSRR